MKAKAERTRRVQIALRDDQIKKLAEHEQKTGAKMGAVMRIALDKFFKEAA